MRKIALSLIVALVVLVGICSAYPKGALYFQSNDPINGNHVGVCAIEQDGTISLVDYVYTNGSGGEANTSKSDQLYSQDSVVVAEDHLFVVNAGSNSLSLFSIDRTNPTNIELVDTVSTKKGGEFPISVAYSSRLRVACVLNGGKENGVVCFRLKKDNHLIRIRGAFHLFGVNQTTPPVGVPGTFSDILFNEDSTLLFAEAKGNAATGFSGFIATFQVSGKGKSFRLSPPILNVPNGLIFFSINLLVGTPNGVLYTDPAAGGYGLAYFDNTGKLLSSSNYTLPNQLAVCWAEYSKKTGHYYLVDTAAKILYEIDVVAENKGILVNSFSVEFALDMAIANIGKDEYAYLLLPRYPGIQVVSIQSSGVASIVQTLNFTTLNPGLFTQSIQGAAVKVLGESTYQ